MDKDMQTITPPQQKTPAGETIQENPDMLKNGDAAIVKIKPTKPLVIETQKENPHMARFAIRDAGSTVAAGICIEVAKK